LYRTFIIVMLLFRLLNASGIAVFFDLEPCHTRVLPICHHLLSMLPSGWKLQLFHAPGIKQCLLEQAGITRLISNAQLQLTPWPIMLRTPKASEWLLMTSAAFWESLLAERVLLFDASSIACSRSSVSLDHFEVFDLIGVQGFSLRDLK